MIYNKPSVDDEIEAIEPEVGAFDVNRVRGLLSSINNKRFDEVADNDWMFLLGLIQINADLPYSEFENINNGNDIKLAFMDVSLPSFSNLFNKDMQKERTKHDHIAGVVPTKK